VKTSDGSTAATARKIEPREVHLRDLIGVVTRHSRLVLLIVVLVTGAAWFHGRRSVPSYQSRLTVQVSSPKQVFARLDDIDVDELALKTDPILSEALVLTTERLALKVVDTLELQLEVTDPAIFRGDVFTRISVDSLARPDAFTLMRKGRSGWELRDASGKAMQSGSYDRAVAGPGFSFFVVPSDVPEHSVPFRIVRPQEAAAWVSGALAYVVREGTNAVDISFTGTDQTLVPLVLNAAAVALRFDGARRARDLAERKRDYIADQLARADAAFQQKLGDMQRFKEHQEVTDVTAEETAVVTAIQEAEQERQKLLIQTSTIRESMADTAVGVETLNRLAASVGVEKNSALGYQIESLLKLYEERRTLTAGTLGLRDENPRVDALDQRIRQGHLALWQAVRAALNGLQGQLAAVDRNLGDLKGRLRAFPGKESRIAQLQLETNILNDTYKYLLGQYQSARMQEATIAPYITILDGASPPASIGTTLRQKVLLGFLVGLLLALSGAFLLEYLDQTVKTTTDVERLTGVPVLGMIPHDPVLAATGNGNGRPRPIVTLGELQRDDPTAEAYRSLRTNVTFVGAEKPLQFIAVTSAGPGEGKSTTATNLAVTLAQGGSKTILIDGDLRRPLVHAAFGLVQEPGLTNVLIGVTPVKEAVRPNVANGLDVLPAGSIPPNPSELLGSDAMHGLVAELRRTYQYIIMDTPPTLPVTDAVVVATAADATILVVRSGDTEETAVERAVDLLNRVNARIAGTVLNGMDRRRDTYYSYYSYRRDTKARQPVKSLKARLSGMF